MGSLRLFLYVTLKSHRSTAGFNSLLSKQLDAAQILYLSSNNISISSDDDVQWTLDGEDGGIYSYAEIENLKQALPIICDKRAYAEVSCKYSEE